MGIILKNGVYYSGPRGNGIRSITQNQDFTLTILLTDGTTYTTSPCRGAKGASPTSIEFNDNSTITFTFDDESTFTSPPINFLPPVDSGDIGKTLIVNENSMWDTEDVSFENWTKYVNTDTPDQSQPQAVVIASRLPVATPSDAGKAMVVNNQGQWSMTAVDYLPAAEATDAGSVLMVNSLGGWSIMPIDLTGDGLPEVDSTDAGCILRVDSQGEWGLEELPDLPIPSISDEGKVLGIDSSGDFVLLSSGASGLPSVTSSDSGKVLTVNGSGNWVAATPSGGGGSGLPSVTSNDDGKILMVDNGVWSAVEVEYGDEESY